MDDAHQERKLTTILSADVVGYSAMMRRDEAGTLRRLTALRREIIDPKVALHGGRTIKLMGDGSLVEFASVVGAVRFAVDLQHSLSDAQSGNPEDARIAFRIGINVGDVIVEGDDIYGDGVNVAARIEGLAPPGGIAVSRTVYDHVRDKLDLDLAPMGPQTVKNIPEPIEVYSVTLSDASRALVRPVPAAEPQGSPGSGTGRLRAIGRRPVLVAAALVAVAAGWIAAFGLGPSAPPVIAVLPFQDSSPEEHRGLLSDPLSDGILAHLARYPELTVIARGSSFRYRDADRDLREIGAQLTADYILEGSFHFDGETVAVNAALVDVEDAAQVWSDQISVDIDDLMTVIADVGQRVAYQVEDYLGQARVEEAGRINSDALLMTMKARRATMRGLSKENNDAVIEMNRETVELYPEDAWGHLAMAFALRTQVRFGWAEDPEATLADAVYHGEKAVQLAPDNYSAHFALGRVRMQQGDQQRAIRSFETALTLNPSSADTINALAQAYFYLGENEEALKILDRSARIDPLPSFVHSWVLAWVLWQDGQCEEAEAAFGRIASPPPAAQKLAAVIQVCLGDMAAAEAAIDAYLASTPDWTLEKEAASQEDVWAYEPGRLRWLADLEKAGLPA